MSPPEPAPACSPLLPHRPGFSLTPTALTLPPTMVLLVALSPPVWLFDSEPHSLWVAFFRFPLSLSGQVQLWS